MNKEQLVKLLKDKDAIKRCRYVIQTNAYHDTKKLAVDDYFEILFDLEISNDLLLRSLNSITIFNLTISKLYKHLVKLDLTDKLNSDKFYFFVKLVEINRIDFIDLGTNSFIFLLGCELGENKQVLRLFFKLLTKHYGPIFKYARIEDFSKFLLFEEICREEIIEFLRDDDPENHHKVDFINLMYENDCEENKRNFFYLFNLMLLLFQNY